MARAQGAPLRANHRGAPSLAPPPHGDAPRLLPPAARRRGDAAGRLWPKDCLVAACAASRWAKLSPNLAPLSTPLHSHPSPAGAPRGRQDERPLQLIEAAVYRCKCDLPRKQPFRTSRHYVKD